MAAPLEPGENQILLNGKLYNLNTKRSPQDIIRQDLQTFPAPATIGPADYNTDPVTAVWVMSDFSGGIGVEDITGADTTRYRWGTADARSPGAITLGPLVTQTRPNGIIDEDTFNVFGDVPGTDEEFYCVVLDLSAGTWDLYAWDETNDTWRGAAGNIFAYPGEKPPARFRGTGANTQLFRQTANAAVGPKVLRTTGPGTVNITSPGATYAGWSFEVWDNKIWTIATDGKLYYSRDGTTFTAIVSPETGADLQLDRGEGSSQLISWYNLAGESTLYVITDRTIWAYNALGGRFEHVYSIPPHPASFGSAAVWRPSEDLWFGVGGSIIRRTPAGVSVPLSGPGADADGLPSGFLGTIRGMVPEYNGLYAAIYGFPRASQKASLLVYTGSGWHVVWEASAASTTRYIIQPYISQASGAYRIWWGYDSYGYTIELRPSPYSPRQGFTAGVDKFAASSYLETGRFWGQTQGFYKLAHRLEVFMDHATSTEKVTVYYQTDTVTSWTQLGSAVTTGRDTVPASPFTTLYFGTADANGIYPGIRFNWIKFKYEFARGGTTTNTPVFVAGSFHFVKLRDSTPSITVDLDFTEDIGGRTPGQQKAELRALANNASQFYTLREGMNVYGVVVASFVDYGASGADQRGNGSISIVCLQATQVS